LGGLAEKEEGVQYTTSSGAGAVSNYEVVAASAMKTASNRLGVRDNTIAEGGIPRYTVFSA